jgi:hypothetical protein
MRIAKYFSIMILSLLLAVGAFACGGGGKDPVNNDPHNQGTTGAKLMGRVLDREGNPAGKPWVTTKLTTSSGAEIAPAQQPASTGPDAGKFEFLGLPVGVPMTLEIELFEVSIGRNLGWIQQVTLTSSGTYDLGDLMLENDFLDMGWSSYVAKNYPTAILHFNRALADRFVQSKDLTYSSSAYTGIGWVYAKRGKDHQSGLQLVDGDTWIDTLNSYEWDQAITQFKIATSNPQDADAWAGMAGTYLTLVGQAMKDPILTGPWIPYYGYIHFYFPESEDAIDKALQADPNYKSAHDEISANDLRATKLFLRWIRSESITVNEVVTLSQASDLNQGSMQLLEVLQDLILYNPYPQL